MVLLLCDGNANCVYGSICRQRHTSSMIRFIIQMRLVRLCEVNRIPKAKYPAMTSNPSIKMPHRAPSLDVHVPAQKLKTSFLCFQIKPECPLCKQTFKSIIHNVTSMDNYEEYKVEEQQRQVIQSSWINIQNLPQDFYTINLASLSSLPNYQRYDIVSASVTVLRD